MNENLFTGEAYKQEKQKKEILKQEENKELKEIFNRIFSTSDGKKFGEWLIRQCGFFENSVMTSKNGILLNETVYNEARRSIYLELRRFLDFETLINLEIKR